MAWFRLLSARLGACEVQEVCLASEDCLWRMRQLGADFLARPQKFGENIEGLCICWKSDLRFHRSPNTPAIALSVSAIFLSWHGL
jgi:hypothetical protein